MIEVTVSSVAIDHVPVARNGSTVVDAAQRLREPTVPAVLVAEADQTVAGIVTESDVVAVVAERGGDLPVESFMSRPVVSVLPSTPIGIAADRMRDAGVTLLPVIDEGGACEGVVTRERLAPYLSRHRLDVDWKNEPLSLASSAAGEDTVTARES